MVDVLSNSNIVCGREKGMCETEKDLLSVSV